MADLKALKKEWYEKLAASGFTDIEDDQGNLKAEVNVRSAKLKRWLDDQEFYNLAQKYLLDHHFDCDKERLVWLLFTEGKSIRKIEEIMSIYRDKVHKIIQKHQSKAGLERWKKS